MIAPVSSAGRDDILSAIRQASAETGSNFDYLLNTAMRESSLQCTAKSKTSSACGLFQFVDQTWLGLVKRFGTEHGMSNYSNAISQDSSGHYSVASADTKQAILALRQDPKVSALMAGEAANETEGALSGTLGGSVGSGDLYLAHFLGTAGAKKLIAANQADPNAQADQLFPQAASANRNVFYHADGRAKSVGEIYSWAKQPCGVSNASAGTASAASAAASTKVSTTAAAGLVPVRSPRNVTAALTQSTATDYGASCIAQPFFTESWTPGQSSSADAGVPSSNLMLSPDILHVLAATQSAPHRAAYAGRG